MNSKKIESVQYIKANISFIVTFVNALLNMLVGFLMIKLTITLYGEGINGIVRFILIITQYTILMVNSFVAVITIQLIKCYKNNDKDGT